MHDNTEPEFVFELLRRIAGYILAVIEVLETQEDSSKGIRL